MRMYGISLVVQGIRLCLLMQSMRGEFLAQGTEVPRALRPKNENVHNRSYTVTKPIKTLNMVHIKKKILEKKRKLECRNKGWLDHISSLDKKSD